MMFGNYDRGAGKRRVGFYEHGMMERLLLSLKEN